MNDIIVFSAVLMVGYLCFMGIVVFLGKVFFPFLTKEELEKRNNLSSLKG